ncbi:hypothetical protein MNBD_BACTEROID01-409, partial [hydrothermal vent metagenome]
GCYHQRFGTYYYQSGGIEQSEYRTIAEILKNEGYYNGYIGKLHYGRNDKNINKRSFPLNHGYDYFYGHTSARKHYLIHNEQAEQVFQRTKKEFERTGQSLQKGPFWENNNQIDVEGFSTELFGKKACEFISSHKDNPFFLTLSFNAVHNFTHQLPTDYLKRNHLKGYRDWDPSKEEYMDWYEKGRYPNNPEGRQLYLGQLQFLDIEIGRVLDCLEKNNITENTLIIYVSDNGGPLGIYANNYPLAGGKYTLHEGGLKVPMIFSWKGEIGEGQVVENVISTMDILPTICDYTGAKIPDNIDGLSIKELLNGKNPQLKNDTLVWDTGFEQAVRVGKWKLKIVSDEAATRYENNGLVAGRFLYDLEKDVGETTNVAGMYPDKFEALKKVYENWKNQIKNH